MAKATATDDFALKGVRGELKAYAIPFDGNGKGDMANVRVRCEDGVMNKDGDSMCRVFLECWDDMGMRSFGESDMVYEGAVDVLNAAEIEAAVGIEAGMATSRHSCRVLATGMPSVQPWYAMAARAPWSTTPTSASEGNPPSLTRPGQLGPPTSPAPQGAGLFLAPPSDTRIFLPDISLLPDTNISCQELTVLVVRIGDRKEWRRSAFPNGTRVGDFLGLVGRNVCVGKRKARLLCGAGLVGGPG